MVMESYPARAELQGFSNPKTSFRCISRAGISPAETSLVDQFNQSSPCRARIPVIEAKPERS
jgi:hypothetical protein